MKIYVFGDGGYDCPYLVLDEKGKYLRMTQDQMELFRLTEVLEKLGNEKVYINCYKNKINLKKDIYPDGSWDESKSFKACMEFIKNNGETNG